VFSEPGRVLRVWSCAVQGRTPERYSCCGRTQGETDAGVDRHPVADGGDRAAGSCLLHDGDRTSTFAETDARSDEVAAGAAALGMTKDERVGTLSPSRPSWWPGLALWRTRGLLKVPLNAFLKGGFLHHQLALHRGAC
jgi:hypothetical protein